jgi:hypothetical protein
MRYDLRYIDLEQKTRQPPDNPFGSRLLPIRYGLSPMYPGRTIRWMAEWTGLEPATPGVTGRYSNQLNYHSRNCAAHHAPVGGC